MAEGMPSGQFSGNGYDRSKGGDQDDGLVTGLKVLVAVKRVVDPGVRIRVKRDGTGVELDNVKMSMNPFDEIAVEAAVQLKEAGKASEIVVLSIGKAKAEDTLRQALAMGADRAILVVHEGLLEPLGVAKAIEAIARTEQPDLILLGKQAIDDDYNQTGQMLAARLGWPQATFISKLEIAGDKAIMTREVDAGLQVLEVVLPAVATTDLRLNTPRFVSLPNVMKARAKPLDRRSAEQLGVDLSPRLKVLRVEEPAARKSGTIVHSAAELVDRLRNEAKVLP